VSPRAVLDAVMRKISSLLRESNLRTLIVQPVAQRYTDRAIAAHVVVVVVVVIIIYLFIYLFLVDSQFFTIAVLDLENSVM
jgi:hypothetical protein